MRTSNLFSNSIDGRSQLEGASVLEKSQVRVLQIYSKNLLPAMKFGPAERTSYFTIMIFFVTIQFENFVYIDTSAFP